MLLVDLEWVSTQHYTLGDNAIRIDGQQAAQSNKLLPSCTIKNNV